MKEARHIPTGRIVRASEVDYPEYHGIFQCPHCKVAVRLRKEYTRSDETTITAAFIHPEAETELQRDCAYRVEFDFDAKNLNPGFTESKGQCFKVLKRKFISKLKKHSKVSLTKCYSKNQLSLECVNLFISVSCKLVASSCNGKFIEGQEVYIQEVINAQKVKLDEKVNSDIRESENLERSKRKFILKNQEQIKKDIKDQITQQNLSFNVALLDNICISDEELSNLDFFISWFLMSFWDEYYNSQWRGVYIDYRARIVGIKLQYIIGNIIHDNYLDLNIKRKAVKWLLEFLCCDARNMDKFRTETLDYIFGKYVDNEEIQLICRETNKKMLETLDQSLSDTKLVETFFTQKYQRHFSGENAAIFQEIEKIHNLVFRFIIDYLLDFPWHELGK